MFFILFLCLHVFVISPIVSFNCGPQIDPDSSVIHLIWPEVTNFHQSSKIYQFELHNLLNEKFTEKCRKWYDIKKVKVDDTGVERTLEIINQLRRDNNGNKKTNVINLLADDYYNFMNDDRVLDQIIYAGDMYDNVTFEKNIKLPEYHETIIINFLTNSADDLNKNWTTEKLADDLLAAKLMSKHVAEINSKDLFDFVMKLHFTGGSVQSRESCEGVSNNFKDSRLVLICSDNWNYCFNSKFNPRNKGLRFWPESTERCQETLDMLRSNLLAVLAPTPFKTHSELTIPTVFYATPYMNPEYQSQLVNSINLVPGHLLKYAFIKFINDMGWQRVAIISDDSPFSIEFEKELLELFHVQGIIYNVQGCGINCNFEKAVRELSKMDARIIIANVNEENARDLFKKTERFQKFIMLYRVRPFWNQNKERFISITLGPTRHDYETCSVGGGRVKINSSCTGILHGLNVIAKARASYFYEGLGKREAFKKFTKIMKGNLRSRSTAYVMQSGGKLLSTMEINNYGIDKKTVQKYKEPFTTVPSDRVWCVTKTNDYAKPCDISLVLLFMFIIIIFSITLLLITCYFHSSSPINAVRYQQF